MAKKTFVDGVALPASDLNTYLMNQTVIVCTSGTRPSSPVEGMTIYETDTDRLLVYTTATTGWQQPWNMPWGSMGVAQITANVGSITTLADVAGMSATFTAVANRRLRITAYGNFQSTVNSDYAQWNIANGAGTQVAGSLFVNHIANGNSVMVNCIAYVTTTAGSVTYKVTAGRAGAASGTDTVVASATSPAFIMIEDIGPSGAPA